MLELELFFGVEGSGISICFPFVPSHAVHCGPSTCQCLG